MCTQSAHNVVILHPIERTLLHWYNGMLSRKFIEKFCCAHRDVSTVMLLKQQVKVKLSLCLIKYNSMKMYSLRTLALHHEDVWGSGGLTTYILNFDTIWR